MCIVVFKQGIILSLLLEGEVRMYNILRLKYSSDYRVKNIQKFCGHIIHLSVFYLDNAFCIIQNEIENVLENAVILCDEILNAFKSQSKQMNTAEAYYGALSIHFFKFHVFINFRCFSLVVLGRIRL